MINNAILASRAGHGIDVHQRQCELTYDSFGAKWFDGIRRIGRKSQCQRSSEGRNVEVPAWPCDEGYGVPSDAAKSATAVIS